MSKKTPILLIFACLLMFLYLPYPIQAFTMDGYYVCDFNGLVPGTRNFTQQDDGTNTFVVQSRYGYGINNGNYSINGTTTPSRYTNITVYKNTDQFKFCLRDSGWFSSAVGNTIAIHVYSTLGKMFEIRMQGWGAANQFLDIYDSGAVARYTDHKSVSTVTMYDNFTFNLLANGTYRIILDAISPWAAVNISRSWGNFGNISSVRFVANVGAGGAAWYKIYHDTLKIRTSSAYSWEELGFQTVGSVTEESPSTTSITLTNALPYLTLENQYISGFHTNISYFALQLVGNSDLPKYDINLYIDGVLQGPYDEYYLNGVYMILKWTCDGDDYGTDPIFEILFTKKTAYATATIQFCYIDYDIDGSGVKYFDYENANTVNNLLDGINTYAYDLCYKIWFTNFEEKMVYFRFYDEDTLRPIRFYPTTENPSPTSGSGCVAADCRIDNETVTIEYLNEHFLIKTSGDFNEGDTYALFFNLGYEHLTGWLDPATPKSWRGNYTFTVNYGTIYDVLLYASDNPETPEWTPTQISYYDNLYGPGTWIQFWYPNINNNYVINDHPYIVYNLSYTDLTNNSNYMYYEIMKGSTMMYNNILYVTSPYIRAIEEVDYVFLTTGTYYIRTYSYDDTNNTKQTLLNVSLPVVVTASLPQSPSEPETNAETQEYMTLYGIIGVVVAGCAVAVLTKSPIGFSFGAIPTAYVFSTLNLGGYQLLPVEIGTGLIVVLVIVAVIAWLLG